MKTIDLHGVKHKDVFMHLIEAVNQWETPFVVITGNSDLMKKEVTEILSQFDLSTRDAIDNPGRLIVYERG